MLEEKSVPNLLRTPVSTHRFLDPAPPVLALFLICRYSGSSTQSSLNECGRSLVRSRRGASLPACDVLARSLLELDLPGRSFSVNGSCCLALLATDETRLIQNILPPARLTMRLISSLRTARKERSSRAERKFRLGSGVRLFHWLPRSRHPHSYPQT